MRLPLLLLLLSVAARADTIRVSWAPVTGDGPMTYGVFSQDGASLATTTGTSAVITVPDCGVSYFYVCAMNQAGTSAGTGGAYSRVPVVTGCACSGSNLQFTVVGPPGPCRVQFEPGLTGSWTDVLSAVFVTGILNITGPVSGAAGFARVLLTGG